MHTGGTNGEAEGTWKDPLGCSHARAILEGVIAPEWLKWLNCLALRFP